jgi:hypothetical protein
MFRQRLIFSILILLMGTYVNCHAQAKMIGVISDSLSQDDLPGANVVINNTAQGTASNINGEYYISRLL